MKEIVDRIMLAEGSASRRIEQANKSAADIIVKAKEDADIFLKKTITDTQNSTEENKARILSQLNKKRDEELKLQESAIKDVISKRTNDIPVIVEKVFKSLINEKLI
jgi:vacuolar-type H+-ATPase subunit H